MTATIFKRALCQIGVHDWQSWFDTQYQASLYRWQRQCRRCGRWQFDYHRRKAA